MYTFSEIKIALSESLAKIEQFIQTVSPAILHAKPTVKWSIAEELFHLISSDMGSAQAFCQSVATLRETKHNLRNYNEIITEYREKYATGGTVIPTRLIPNEETHNRQQMQFLDDFSKAASALQQSLSTWTEDTLDLFTVWKHPLLGPVTAREMLFFTIFHNRHHLASMQAKQTCLENNAKM
ncbi:DinB family protein [Xanthocytophaga agilis]|uniref:DinB family protein n=1 Tax=Xanthocytophaga agilis TaxID=3048010 RepID=A0AAE3UCH1_9BACT|nr:DinB family protein [Xanthocytophaga agilis]MDJ1500085.1 DinB family protein [Xanthocytophaga agilis]